MAKLKKRNVVAEYFVPFGLRQLGDFLMLIGAIILIVGLLTAQIVVTVGLGFYIAATCIAIYRSLKVILSGINKRSPDYKASIINICIMGAILALAIFGFVYSIIS